MAGSSPASFIVKKKKQKEVTLVIVSSLIYSLVNNRIVLWRSYEVDVGVVVICGVAESVSFSLYPGTKLAT